MYLFTGFFITTPIRKPKSLPPGSVWRKIDSPFVGVGILLPDRIDTQPEKVRALASTIGIGDEHSWIFLQYECWAGEIDFVLGLGVAGGIPFGPVEESDSELVAAYTKLMENIGISSENSLDFPPFRRGFWGDI